MTIDIMVSLDDRDVLVKKPESVNLLEGNLRTPSSIIDPVFVVDIPQDMNLARCNYLHIPAWNRFYYITNITAVSPDLWEISAHVDVLQSFGAYVMAKNAMVSQNQSGTPYMTDEAISTTAKPLVNTYKFPERLPIQNYIITLIGEEVTTSAPETVQETV